MITFDQVSLQYDAKHTALSNINIHIDKGEFVFIVGPSGAGKSTFVKILTHELVPEQGTVVVNGLTINKLKSSKIPYYRRTLGIVFQDFRLLDDRNVFDNIAFAQKVIEAPGRKIRSRVHAMLAEVKITNKYKEFPKHLSGGEQQRVAIARALINNPPILLADEPTGNLDEDNSWEIMKLLEQANTQGTTVVVVTHNLEIVRTMKKRTIVINNGEVVQEIAEGGNFYEI